MAVTVRFWAAAKAAAGTSGGEYDDEPSLAALLLTLEAAHGPGLGKVLGVASYLIDSEPVGRRDPADVVVPPGSVVEVLPPFAGG